MASFLSKAFANIKDVSLECAAGLHRWRLSKGFKYAAQESTLAVMPNEIGLPALRFNRAAHLASISRHGWIADRLASRAVIEDLPNGRYTIAKMKVEQALDALPPSIISLLAETGIHTRLTGTLDSNRAVARDLETGRMKTRMGHYSPLDRAITVGLRGGFSVLGSGIAKGINGTYLHEIGHAIDHVCGRLSEREDVRAAYFADIDRLSRAIKSNEDVTLPSGKLVNVAKHCRTECHHYLPAFIGGEHITPTFACSEALAEVFAGKLTSRKSGLVALMPNLSKKWDQILLAIDQEMSAPASISNDGHLERIAFA